MRKSSLALLGFGAAVAATGWFGSRHSVNSPKTRQWYDGLNKPRFNPPDFVFPIVWTGLYALMAASGWRTWREGDSPKRTRALWLWGAQLVANGGWPKLFFGERRPVRALIDVILLEALIVAYVIDSADVDRAAAALFIPYAGWVAFATVLNAEIVRRNN